MKHSFYNISSLLGLDRLFAHLNRNRPVVLAFHGVTAEEPGSVFNYEGAHLYRPIFSRLMEHLVSRYRVVSLDRIVDWLKGDGELPRRAVAVTFDDGYRNLLTQAAPELFALGAPATVFVTTDFVAEGKMLWPDRLLAALAASSVGSLTVEAADGQRKFPLSGEEEKLQTNIQIREMVKALPDDDRQSLIEDIVERLEVEEETIKNAWNDYRPLREEDLWKLGTQGIAIGSHTCSHPVLARCAPQRMANELRRSKQIIERATGTACTSFAYPNGAPGDFNQETRREVEAAGYRGAVTTVKSRVMAGQDPFEIPRYILTHNDITTNEFAVEVSGFATFLRGFKK
jgi:peptidoglycan/xylan/chitin deacetylase (PgdA/CDA1 family)